MWRPAVLAYACGMQGFFDRVILAYFVACGVSRLARYNVTAEALSGGTGKVAYFEGTPIPTSIVLVGMLALAAYLGAIGEQLWLGDVELAGFQAALARARLRRVGLADDQPDSDPENLRLARGRRRAGATPAATARKRAAAAGITRATVSLVIFRRPRASSL